MSQFRHILRTYALRFRRELTVWVALTTTGSILALSSAPIGVLAAIAHIEIIVAIWLLLVICLADEAFGTLADKHTRPLSRTPAALARPALLVLAFLPAMTLRFCVWVYWAAPDRSRFHHWLLSELAPTLARLALLGLLLQTIAWLARGVGTGRKISISLLVSGGLVTLWFANRWLPIISLGTVLPGNYGGGHSDVSHHLFHALPPSAVVVGGWAAGDSPSSIPRPALKVYKKIDLMDKRAARAGDDIEWRISNLEQRGSILGMNLRLRALPDRLDAVGIVAKQPILLMRYSNGFFGAPTEVKGARIRSPLMLSPLDEIIYEAKFKSPLALGWIQEGWDEILKDAELWVMAETGDPIVPPADTPLRWNRKKVTREELKAAGSPTGFQSRQSNREGHFIVTPVVPSEEEAGLAVQVDACMSLFRYWEQDEALNRKYRTLLEAKGRRVVPHLLNWPAWSEGQWIALVRPILMKHTQLEDRPTLLARLADDPRLTELFIAKGWAGDALPVLRAKAAKGKWLPVEAIQLLAAEPASISPADLATIVSRLDRGAEEFAAKLRQEPDFEWESFVREGWKLQKYNLRRGESWLYALWAAQLGDSSGLRRLAELAAWGRPWERDRLRELIPSAPPDLLPFLDENLDQLRFNPTEQIWQLPGESE